jgi:hypothetical protein
MRLEFMEMCRFFTVSSFIVTSAETFYRMVVYYVTCTFLKPLPFKVITIYTLKYIEFCAMQVQQLFSEITSVK